MPYIFTASTRSTVAYDDTSPSPPPPILSPESQASFSRPKEGFFASQNTATTDEKSTKTERMSDDAKNGGMSNVEI